MGAERESVRYLMAPSVGHFSKVTIATTWKSACDLADAYPGCRVYLRQMESESIIWSEHNPSRLSTEAYWFVIEDTNKLKNLEMSFILLGGV